MSLGKVLANRKIVSKPPPSPSKPKPQASLSIDDEETSRVTPSWEVRGDPKTGKTLSKGPATKGDWLFEQMHPDKVWRDIDEVEQKVKERKRAAERSRIKRQYRPRVG